MLTCILKQPNFLINHTSNPFQMVMVKLAWLNTSVRNFISSTLYSPRGQKNCYFVHRFVTIFTMVDHRKKYDGTIKMGDHNILLWSPCSNIVRSKSD